MKILSKFNFLVISLIFSVNTANAVIVLSGSEDVLDRSRMHSYSHAFAIALGEENERRGSGGFVEVTGEKGTFIVGLTARHVLDTVS